MEDIDLSSLSVLIVDDYPPMRIILRRVLSSLKITEIAEAVDGFSALEVLEEFIPDIIIADRVMEPMDGIELTRKIRAGHGNLDPYTPIIMVSAHSDLDRITEARDAGVSEFLVKPISAKLVYLRLCSVVTSPRDFIKTKEYFGPDRRRRGIDHGGPDRRGAVHEYLAPTRTKKRPT